LVALPLTLAAGYGLALLLLGSQAARFTPFWGSLASARLRPLYRNFAELFGVNQLTMLQHAILRFFQSYLRPGTLSAFNYASQTLVPLYELLSFKELYMIPLSAERQRGERLERLLAGILLLTTPIALFLGFHAGSIIEVLFQRGRFDARAQAVTAMVFALLALGLIPDTVSTPLGRLFQITDRIFYSGLQTLGVALALLLAGGILVFALKLDVLGLTLAHLLKNLCGLGAALIWLPKIDIRLNFRRLGKYTAAALAAGAGAVGLARLLPAPSSALLDLMIQGAAFAALTAAFYWPLRRRIRLILYGTPEDVATAWPPQGARV
jgi:peptidoglycan biosynthesis protein MviN/MurJ (putative lipid II flippase)